VPENDDDPRSPIAGELGERLPEGADGRPYLAAFGATHLDKDHTQGFGGLLEGHDRRPVVHARGAIRERPG
jgi:hypothetical protein